MPIDSQVSDIASALLACLCDTLANSVAGPVCRCCLYPGESTTMDVCERGPNGDGQAAVRVAQVYPSSEFPQQDAGPLGHCDIGAYAVVFELSVYRCAATVNDDGSPPTCDEVTFDAVAAADDAAAMRRAVSCCFDWAGRMFQVGQWIPAGPTGGCHGGALTVTAQVFDCCPEVIP